MRHRQHPHQTLQEGGTDTNKQILTNMSHSLNKRIWIDEKVPTGWKTNITVPDIKTNITVPNIKTNITVPNIKTNITVPNIKTRATNYSAKIIEEYHCYAQDTQY
jgi:hypothetical protein